VKLDDNTIVGDPMEKTTLEALDWTIGKGFPFPCVCTLEADSVVGDTIIPNSTTAPHRTQLTIRRRFQFSSALKRMSTVSTLPNGRIVVAVKGAPETIKEMLHTVPEGYDETYTWFTRKGSRVLALGIKETEHMAMDKVVVFLSKTFPVH
jgi:cation-transporting ATPase 13A1